MKKYIYDNATVYITIPNAAQIENMHKATEQFAVKLVKRGFIKNESGRNNRRTRSGNSNARRRNKRIEGTN
jgi:hypothetical protein